MATTKKTNSTTKANPADKALELFADMIIERIDTIKTDWKKPWISAGANQWACNLSGREYNGMNALMLSLHCQKEGYKYPVFCTFDRAIALNYKKDKQGKKVRVTDKDGKELPMVHVTKGQKGFPVFITVFAVVHKSDRTIKISYDDYTRLTDEARKDYNTYPKLQVYYVYNIDQTNMKEARPEEYERLTAKYNVTREVASDDFSFEPIDRMITDNLWCCPIKPTEGDQAYYSISKDEIVVPTKQQFVRAESFYSNLLHEITHSTGAEKRLGRIKPTTFGSKEYAKEELVAELTAAMVSSRYGMTKCINTESVPYIRCWLNSLKESSEFIKTVLNDVRRASYYISEAIDKIQATAIQVA